MNRHMFFLVLLLATSPAQTAPPTVVHPVKDEATHELLRSLLAEPDPAMRVHALRALAAIGDPSDAEAARALLADPVAGVRAEALRTVALAGFAAGDEASWRTLAADPCALVRAAFHELLPLLETDRAAALAWRGLEDEDLRVRVAAAAHAAVLVEDHAPLVDLLEFATPPVFRGELFRGLLKHAPAEREQLLSWGLDHEDPGLAASALESLGPTDTAFAGQVARLLASPLLFVREEAARAVGRLGVPALIEPAVALLPRADPGLKRVLCASLGAFREHEAVAALRAELAAEQGPLVHRSAARALLTIQTAGARDVLLDMLDNPQASVRAACAEAVGEWGDLSSAPHLVPLLHDGDTDVLLQALYGLYRLDASAASGSMDRLRVLLSHDDEHLVAAAIRLLGALDDRASIPDMARLLTHISYTASHVPREAALETLVKMEYDALMERAMAIAATEVIPPPPGFPSPSFDHVDARIAALRYLARFGDASTADKLFDALAQTPPPAMRSVLADVMERWTGIAYRALPDHRALLYDIESLARTERAGSPPPPGIEPVRAP